jgi:prevent-host-death family protein
MPASGKPARTKRSVPPALAETPIVKQVTVHEAKTNLSRLLDDVLAGHTVIIARRDKPVVRLEPVEPVRKRQFGRYKGMFEIGPEFFEPLPEDELKAWEGD